MEASQRHGTAAWPLPLVLPSAASQRPLMQLTCVLSSLATLALCRPQRIAL